MDVCGRVTFEIDDGCWYKMRFDLKQVIYLLNWKVLLAKLLFKFSG